jgi:hypothetical protein
MGKNHTSIQIVGLVNIILAVLWGLYYTVLLMISLARVLSVPEDEIVDPLMIYSVTHFYYLFLVTHAMALFIAGIGLLKVRNWGRQLCIIVAVLTMILAMVILSLGKLTPNDFLTSLFFSIMISILVNFKSVKIPLTARKIPFADETPE